MQEITHFRNHTSSNFQHKGKILFLCKRVSENEEGFNAVEY